MATVSKSPPKPSAAGSLLDTTLPSVAVVDECLHEPGRPGRRTSRHRGRDGVDTAPHRPARPSRMLPGSGLRCGHRRTACRHQRGGANVPGLRIAAPRDGVRLAELLTEAVCFEQGPSLLRFPKGSTPVDVPAVERLQVGDVLHCSTAGSRDVLLVAVGPMASQAYTAARDLEDFGIGTTVIDPRWLLPVSPVLTDPAAGHRLVVTVEDGLRHDGLGTARRPGRSRLPRLLPPPAHRGHGMRGQRARRGPRSRPRRLLRQRQRLDLPPGRSPSNRPESKIVDVLVDEALPLPEAIETADFTTGHATRAGEPS